MTGQQHFVTVFHSIHTFCIDSEQSTSWLNLPEVFYMGFNSQGRGRNIVSWILFQSWASESVHLGSQTNVEHGVEDLKAMKSFSTWVFVMASFQMEHCKDWPYL